MLRKSLSLWAGVLCLTATSPSSLGADLDQIVGNEVPGLVETYKYLHSHPELSYHEKETARMLAGKLRELGFEVTENVGDYRKEGRTSFGLVGVLKNGSGPTVMVRTDLDALPVEEKTGVPYASHATGPADSGDLVPVMHACGHDLHMTSFLGTARVLSQLKDQWKGTLVMIGQPSEERGSGAKAMLDGGLYDRFPKPDYALALHSDASLAAGKVGWVPGYALANVDSVDIEVRGKGGHGAFPQATKDPVVLAAQIIMGLQTIVSRQVAPDDPAVVTVGSIHGGTKHNIIPDGVHLQLTVRSYKPEVRKLLLESIRRIAVETGRAAGFPEDLLPVVTIQEEEFTPSTYNDPKLAERMAAVFERVLGPDRVVRKEPVMGGEDFSRFGLEGKIPIFIFWLGAVPPEKIEEYARRGATLPSLHSSEFAPLPEPAIRTGVKAMTLAVLELMAK